MMTGISGLNCVIDRASSSPFQFGHLHVGDDEVEDLLADEVETDLSVACSNDVVAFAFEPALQHPLHAGVIIDNKNLWPSGLLHSDGSISCF